MPLVHGAVRFEALESQPAVAGGEQGKFALGIDQNRHHAERIDVPAHDGRPFGHADHRHEEFEASVLASRKCFGLGKIGHRDVHIRLARKGGSKGIHCATLPARMRGVVACRLSAVSDLPAEASAACRLELLHEAIDTSSEPGWPSLRWPCVQRLDLSVARDV